MILDKALHLFDHIARPVAYGVSGGLSLVPVAVAAGSDSLSILSAEGWLQLALQAGSTFVFALFLLWVLPQWLKFQREMAQDMQRAIKDNNDANANVVKTLTDAFERHDTAWREFMVRRGYCPVRDGKEHQ